MYPALEHLKEEGLVTFKEEGRKKVYSLTKEGKEAVTEIGKNMSEMFENMRDNMKLMTHMIGFDDKRHDEIMDLFLGAIQRGQMPFKEVMRSTTEMKMEFWNLYKKGLIKKRAKEINKIMDEANMKLKKIKKWNHDTNN